MPVMSSAAIANIISRLGEDPFVSDLISLLKEVVSFDSSLIMAYPGEGQLRIVHDDLMSRDRKVFNTKYREGLWAMSPLYLRACSGFRGPFHIRDMAPKSFKQSNFYKHYWSKSGTIDQFAYISQLPGGTPLVLSLERSAALRAYNNNEIRRLKSCSEVIVALMEKHWQEGLNSIVSSKHLLQIGPETLLDRFSTPHLTPREKEVLELLLKGLSNKLIGRELGISHETVKVYCKNLYAKTGVAGRPEIYAKVVESLYRGGKD